MSSFKEPRSLVPDDATGDSATVTTGFSAADLSLSLGLGTSLLVGRYSVDLATGTWWWSDEVYTMHGWRPDEVEPGLDALRSRKHPDDRGRVVRAAGDALRLGRPFACGHRIVDRSGRTRSVVVTGQGTLNPRQGTPELVGFVVDITPVQKEALERRSDQVVSRAFVSQATIEQAKGVIVAVRGVDEATATAVLVGVAREVGISLRLAAEQLMAAVHDRATGTPMTEQTLTDALAAVRPVSRPRGREPLLTRRPRAAA
ncbi:PAS and ANTAR domain-containing protein [Promicromonospora thailandica]|uniref:ANTAR domain-containing protein n=1 Tax=Promicromonospora thailandica TaxID=765201 RepID=A0A9X2JX93_9MICO|nr:PAS and ANTAR domain-containing protein [Promicromonospora thailandica]MCP2267001.1 ANTAR domain-containing protein [Promicromonospora thailandica]BFF16720.1 hypothetical protein GCM10025730_02410 [Promicromonospora thailandica]